MSLPNGTTFGEYEDEYRSYGSPSSGSMRVSTATSGYAESSASGMYTLAVEEFKPRNPELRRQISQSEPMGSRSVKNVSNTIVLRNHDVILRNDDVLFRTDSHLIVARN